MTLFIVVPRRQIARDQASGGRIWFGSGRDAGILRLLRMDRLADRPGKDSLGDMTLYLSIFRQGQTTFQSILAGIGNIYENNLFMANYFEFFELKPQMRIAEPPKKLPASLTRGIEFRGVGFRYPESEEWALRDVDLRIRPARKSRS